MALFSPLGLVDAQIVTITKWEVGELQLTGRAKLGGSRQQVAIQPTLRIVGADRERTGFGFSEFLLLASVNAATFLNGFLAKDGWSRHGWVLSHSHCAILLTEFSPSIL